MTDPTQAVTGFFDTMKQQPLSLALVVMNVALLLLFYVIVQSAEKRTQMRATELNHVLQLLADCRKP